MADRRTWVAVVIGVAGNLIIMRPLMTEDVWNRVFNIAALSSFGVVARNLWKVIQLEEEIKRGAEDTEQRQT